MRLISRIAYIAAAFALFAFAFFCADAVQGLEHKLGAFTHYAYAPAVSFFAAMLGMVYCLNRASSN